MANTSNLAMGRGKAAGHELLIGLFLALCVLAASAVGIFYGWGYFQEQRSAYAGRIYPNVTVLGISVGGLSTDQAATLIERAEAPLPSTEIVLTHGEREWHIPWLELGLRLDPDATADEAYRAGREGDVFAQVSAWLQVAQVVTPVLTLDLEMTRARLNALTAEVAVPVQHPRLHLEQGEVVVGTGQPGQRLDVDVTLEAVKHAALHGGEVELVVISVEPAAPTDVQAIRAQVAALLSAPLTLFTVDVRTAERFEWRLEQEDVAAWLQLTGDGDDLAVTITEDAVKVTLAECAALLTEGRGLRLDEATQQVITALRAGRREVRLYLTHPERTCVVQSGDTLEVIAARFSMPPGLIAEANPGADMNWLHPGQLLRIPSQDVLTPHLPVAGKRIVINVAAQQLYAYEDGALRHSWPVSTGLPDSPTHRGVFQILSKEERAYGSQWDLWMPYFMAIYPAGGDVYNGIHELPILSSGRRLWEGALGAPASYGCIILGIPAAETLYHWSEVGVLVVVE